MENGTKLRILYLYQHLIQNTDPDHPESTVELMKMLKEKYDIEEEDFLSAELEKNMISK